MIGITSPDNSGSVTMEQILCMEFWSAIWFLSHGSRRKNMWRQKAADALWKLGAWL